ncbi:MAG TPA: GNAT family N-acetyltransferase [Steroidobacteraceae bacterium]|nr:GNAT family N-acetyltransferase [Steroidobacteraceae bacterium]
MFAAPVSLTTARLVLRQPTSGDAEAIFSYAGDPEATRYMSWPMHRELEDARRYIDLALASWERVGLGAYLIERQGVVIGSTGLDPGEAERAATGYILVREAWGQGYATEACRAMIALGRSLGLKHIGAQCQVDHLASARVLEKSGMRFAGVWRRHIVLPNLSGEPQNVRDYLWRAPGVIG